MKKLLCVLLCLLLGVATACAEEGVFVTPVKGLSEEFLFGADISSVLSLEASGVVFREESGAEADLFALLADAGWNAVRLRIWVDPFDAEGHSYGGGGGSLANACAIARRASAVGLCVMADFHYSDFWADPNKQQCPKAWVGMTADEKADALYAYTLDALAQLADTGADIALVQVGNETDNALAGETSWTAITKLMKAGIRAVREAAPDAKVALHFSQPKASFAQIMDACDVEYDVFAASYYPYWHGSLDNMTAQLRLVAEKYGVQTLIAETSYPYTLEDGDQHGNSVPDSNCDMAYAVTPQGQANALRAVTQAASDAGCIGLFYWEPAWLPVPGDTLEQRSALWEANGSGWASSYAASYDPDDAGVWYGGSAWDNQALLNADGTAAPNLRFPLYARSGATGERAIDGYSTPQVTCYVTEGIALPDTVDALYTDGTSEPIAVTWDTDSLPLALGEYDVAGVAADGAAVRCALTITAHNALLNPGFEDEDMSMYVVRNNGTDEAYRATSQNDTKTGEGLFHFFDAEAFDFSIEQTVTDLPAGTYAFGLWIHGGDVSQSDMTIYVLLDGEPFASLPTGVTKWREWQHPIIEGIPVTPDTVVTVGAHISGSGAKPWGKLDDWLLALTE